VTPGKGLRHQSRLPGNFYLVFNSSGKMFGQVPQRNCGFLSHELLGLTAVFAVLAVIFVKGAPNIAPEILCSPGGGRAIRRLERRHPGVNATIH
jgi:hypothetical protein